MPELDDLLAAWGQEERLSDKEALAVREAVVGTALSADWWRDLNAHLGEVMAKATRPPRVRI